MSIVQNIETEKLSYPFALAQNGVPNLSALQAYKEIHYRFHEGTSDIYQLRKDWIELEKTAKTPVFFQSYAWIEHVGRTLSQSGTEFRPIIATAWRNDRLIAVWPLQRIRRLRGNFLGDFGDPFSQYSEALIASEFDQKHILAGFVTYISLQLDCDGLLLRKVRAGSNLEKLMEIGAVPQNTGSAAPWLSFESYQSFDQYLATLKSKTRKNLRNFRNRLARSGPLEHTVTSDPDDIATALEDIFTKRKNWLLDRGLTSSAFRHPKFEHIITSISNDPESGITPLVTALKHDGKPIASQLGFVHNSRYYAYISARDTNLDASVSAGRIHLEEILKTCFERKIKEVDLLAPAIPYKLTWTKQAADVFDLFLPTTSWGYLVGDRVIGRAIPAARNIYGALPTFFRRPLADIINRSGKTLSRK